MVNGALALAVAAALGAAAVPREVAHTRCQQATTACLQASADDDDGGLMCATQLSWVTRDGAIGDDVLKETCHKALMTRWLGIEWFDRNVDGRQR